jgi:hypothetical protein
VVEGVASEVWRRGGGAAAVSRPNHLRPKRLNRSARGADMDGIWTEGVGDSALVRRTPPSFNTRCVRPGCFGCRSACRWVWWRLQGARCSACDRQRVW